MALSCFTVGSAASVWYSSEPSGTSATRQEVAVATRPTEELAVIAADLGYTDQPHLTRDFRTATGITPDAYRRTISSLSA